MVSEQAVAYAVKDLRIFLRFKFYFITSTFLPALINLGLFVTIFYGFVYGGNASVNEVDKSNFAAFVLLGTMASTLFSNSFGAFRDRFANEKYWQTTYAILASPLSSWAILVGVGISEGLRFSVIAIPFLAATYILFPTSFAEVVSTLMLLVTMYLLVSGLSLIRGAVYLVNEDWDSFFQYLVIGTSYLSCFYYPVTFIPPYLRPFAMVNPVYFVVDSIRAIWLGFSVSPTYLIVAGAAAIASPVIGTYLFRKVWRNLDLTGY